MQYLISTSAPPEALTLTTGLTALLCSRTDAQKSAFLLGPGWRRNETKRKERNEIETDQINSSGRLSRRRSRGHPPLCVAWDSRTRWSSCPACVVAGRFSAERRPRLSCRTPSRPCEVQHALWYAAGSSNGLRTARVQVLHAVCCSRFSARFSDVVDKGGLCCSM